MRTHPETGAKGIYVNAAFTVCIKDMGDEESTELLQLLYRQAGIPEYQCRLRWRNDTLAFWDNRSTQHYAVSDYWPAVRVDGARHGRRRPSLLTYDRSWSVAAAVRASDRLEQVAVGIGEVHAASAVVVLISPGVDSIGSAQ